MSCPGVFDGELGYFLGASVGWGWVHGAVGILGEESWYALVCPWARSWVCGLEVEIALPIPHVVAIGGCCSCLVV